MSMLAMDIGNENALQSLHVPKFLCYLHILLCLLNCLLYHPAMLEFYFCVHIAYSYCDLWSLCSRTLCKAFFELKSISKTPMQLFYNVAFAPVVWFIVQCG